MTVKGCEGQGGKWQKGCAVARGPVAEAGHPQGADGDVREEERGPTAPLAHLPGKSAPATCTEVKRKDESKLSVPESPFLYAFGVVWPRWAQFQWEEAAGGWAGKDPAAGGT